MRVVSHHRYSWQQYLALEHSSNVRHEFSDGEIFAMAGGTPAHAALALAVGSELRAQLKGKPCTAYSSDLRVRVLATGLGAYPDVTVVCGEAEYDPESRETVVNPVLLVEVLSDSTEAYDRGEKFEGYKQIPSFKEYVLVSTKEKRVESFRRGERGLWTRTETRGQASLALESIGATLSLAAVYEGIALDS